MKYTLYYTVQNGGDGSAYPMFVESEALAEWDQRHMSEGWGESCTGSVVLESDTEISCDKVISKERFFVEHIKGGSYNAEEMREFIEEFFPAGLPHFSINGIHGNYRKVYIGDKFICNFWFHKKASNEELEEFLNSPERTEA